MQHAPYVLIGHVLCVRVCVFVGTSWVIRAGVASTCGPEEYNSDNMTHCEASELGIEYS